MSLREGTAGRGTGVNRGAWGDPGGTGVLGVTWCVLGGPELTGCLGVKPGCPGVTRVSGGEAGMYRGDPGVWG